MPVLAVTRVGRYYRTTIPREVRKFLDVNENDGRIIIKKKERCAKEY